MGGKVDGGGRRCGRGWKGKRIGGEERRGKGRRGEMGESYASGYEMLF